MIKIWVRCPKGICPRPDSGLPIGNAPVQVPDTEFYRRRIADGSLVLVPGPAPLATPNRKERK